MTAILQPGDRIHAHFPAHTTYGYPTEKDKTLDQTFAQELATKYNAQGIELAFWTSAPNTTGITIVAVFRPAAPITIQEATASM